MEQFNVPEELTRQSVRQIVERVFAVFAPNDEMKESLLLFAEQWKPLWTMKHLIKYMDEKNWGFPEAFAASETA
jgi:hypothetical protein